MVKERYKDESLDVAGAKVRALINEHLIDLGIYLKIPPDELLSPDFMAQVHRHAGGNAEAMASEMEHAIRKHCTVYFDEDPAFYKKLSENLEKLIEVKTLRGDIGTDLQLCGIPELAEWRGLNAMRVIRDSEGGTRAKKMDVRELGSRWASCSPTGNLAFHWKCMMAPSRIIDYVVVHELRHMHHLDHSDAFWNEVDKVMPDLCERKEWLRKNGAAVDL